MANSPRPASSDCAVDAGKSKLSARSVMKSLGTLRWAAILLALLPVRGMIAEGQQAPTDVPTIRVTSSLVFLDVTVLDKKGQPVASGLTKDDFTITEDKKPQRIFSFEAAETHTMSANSGDENPDGKAPVTIFVLIVCVSGASNEKMRCGF